MGVSADSGVECRRRGVRVSRRGEDEGSRAGAVSMVVRRRYGVRPVETGFMLGLHSISSTNDGPGSENLTLFFGLFLADLRGVEIGTSLPSSSTFTSTFRSDDADSFTSDMSSFVLFFRLMILVLISKVGVGTDAGAGNEPVDLRVRAMVLVYSSDVEISCWVRREW